MEEEAKDSEEERVDSKLGKSAGRNLKQSPLSSKFGTAATHGSSRSVTEASNALPDLTGPRVLPNINNGEDSSATTGNKNKSYQERSFPNVHDPTISDQTPNISRYSTLRQSSDKYMKTNESKNADFPKALDSRDTGNIGNSNPFGQQFGLHDNDMESKKFASGVAHSNEKPSTTSYFRNNQREFSLSRILDESSGRENKCENSKADGASELIKSTRVENSGRRNDFTEEDEPSSILPQKRANESSFTKLKSRKVPSNSKIFIQSANGKSQGLKVTSQVDEPPKADDYFSKGKDGINNSNTCLVLEPVGSTSNSLAFDEPFSRNATPESAQCDNVCQNCPQTAVQNLSEPKINGKPDVTSSGLRQVNGNEAGKHNVIINNGCSSLGNKSSNNVESAGCTNLALSNEECNKLVRKSPRKKSVAMRNSGSKPKVGAIARNKTSLCLNKTTLQGEGVTLSSGSREIGDAKIHQGCPQIRNIKKTMEKEAVRKNTVDPCDRAEFLEDETEAPDDKCKFEFGMALNEESVHLLEKPNRAKEEKSEAICPATKVEEAMPPKKGTHKTENQKTASLVVKYQTRKRAAGKAKATVSKYAEDVGDRTEFLDDEAEAPDDKRENKLGMAPEEVVRPLKKPDKSTEEKAEAICPATKCEEAIPPKKGTNETEKQKPSSLVVKHQARKRPAGKAKATVAKELLKSKVEVSRENILNETGDEAEIETMEEMSLPADKHNNSAIARKKSENLVEEDKENRPIDGLQDLVEGRSDGNPTNKSNVMLAKIKSTKVGLRSSISQSKTRVKTEATCFILSGHRLQRKEFQQVIKRLKGRVCRDSSHQWSYQATHFIAADPIRRTEKFCAAAASGR
ncbi:unnamed protein product [Sphenostylis stenocarpa]|uniref:BRCT domain-containing protein n=1 Tax=Sphenostylis stenocarpa TaxID=92480 RepID=A0AA86VZW4_9FABA|nr:unnamed protein product [Sphenostylis stenocarpa]